MSTLSDAQVRRLLGRMVLAGTPVDPALLGQFPAERRGSLIQKALEALSRHSGQREVAEYLVEVDPLVPSDELRHELQVTAAKADWFQHLDFEGALGRLDPLPESKMVWEARVSVVEEWAKFDPVAAEDYIASLPEGDLRDELEKFLEELSQ